MLLLILQLFLGAWSFGGCNPATPGPAEYASTQSRLVQLRDSLGPTYARADPARQTSMREQARARVLTALDRVMFPAWYGTDWDYSGVSQTPGEGKIACGYFITTLLRDAGFQLERARMAQQASLFIIRSLTPREDIKDWSYITPAQFAERVKALPKGLYVVGLDIHTGFVRHSDQGVYFIHSSYMQPAEVLREKAADSEVLAASKRFVLGRVDNDWLMAKWILSEKIATITG